MINRQFITICTKEQKISKANYGVLNSSKKRMRKVKSKGFKKALVESCQDPVVKCFLNFFADSAKPLRNHVWFVSVLY
jgi:hypothetical protein